MNFTEDFATRAAVMADAEALAALWRACGLVVSYNDPADDLRFALDGAGSTVLVAEGAGRIVGSVMVGHDGHRGWLYYVAAAPDCRGRGLGKRMVREAEAWLRARGVRKVQLLVRNSNKPVLAFYEQLGFEPSEVTVMNRWLTD